MPETDVSQELSADRRREILMVLTAEHTNLQAARSAGVVEANGRTTAFFAALSGALVALAFLAQAEGLRDLLLPVSFVFALTVTNVGVITFLRLVQLSTMDTLLVVGINRIRHRYIELIPDMADIEVLSAHDDRAGVMGHAGLTGQSASRLELLATAPAMVAGIDGILAGTVAGIGATLAGAPTPVSVGLGVAVGVVTDAVLLVYGLRAGVRFWSAHPPRNPTLP